MRDSIKKVDWWLYDSYKNLWGGNNDFKFILKKGNWVRICNSNI